MITKISRMDKNYQVGKGGGGGGVLPYVSYIVRVPPHRVTFLPLFGLKTAVHFAQFGHGYGF